LDHFLVNHGDGLLERYAEVQSISCYAKIKLFHKNTKKKALKEEKSANSLCLMAMIVYLCLKMEPPYRL